MTEMFTALDTWIGRTIDAICIVLTAGLFFVITLVVATRLGGFGSPAWSDEIVEFLLAWLIFIGAAGLWRRGEHFRVDLLDQMMTDPTAKARLAIVVELISATFLGILTYYGTFFALSATDTSPTFSLPVSFWLAAMPVSSGLMLAYSLVRLRRLIFLRQVTAE